MMGTVIEERFTFRGSPEVPSPLSSHEPPPSVTLKKSPSETRARSETPSTAWTKKRTRSENRAVEDNMYETRHRAYFKVCFYSRLVTYPGVKRADGGEGPEIRDGQALERVKLKTIFRQSQTVSTWEQLRSDFRRFRGSR